MGKLFLSNIPYSTSIGFFYRVFRGYKSRQGFIIQKLLRGINRRYGFIEVEKADEVAIRFNRMIIEGRKIIVRISHKFNDGRCRCNNLNGTRYKNKSSFCLD